MQKDRHEEVFKEDPRHRQCSREALMGLGLGAANLLWWFGWGYGLGSRPVAEYTYAFGFPMWFFMSCIVGAGLFTILAIFMVRVFFEETPLGEMKEEKGGEQKWTV